MLTVLSILRGMEPTLPELLGRKAIIILEERAFVGTLNLFRLEYWVQTDMVNHRILLVLSTTLRQRILIF